MITEKDIDLINRFIENELEHSEILQFKERYESDREFRNEVNIRSKIHISLKSVARLSSETFSKKHHLMKFLTAGGESSSGKIPLFYKIAVAVIPLLAAGIILVLLQKEKPTEDNLFANYYSTEETNNLIRGLPEGSAEMYDNLLEAHADGVLQEWIADLYQSGADSSEIIEEIYNFGIYCFQKHRYAEALNALGSIANSHNNIYWQECQWYIAGCFLKLGFIAEARNSYSEIARNEVHRFRVQALEMLDVLD